jgi:RND superfamily putative drug exporter
MRGLALFVVRRRRWIVAAAALALPAFAVYGGGVHDRLTTGGRTDTGSESGRAARAVERDFSSSGQSDFVLVVTAARGDVDDDAVRAAGLALTRRLRDAEGVVTAESYWSLGNVGQLRSRDSRQALVVASLRGDADEKLEIAEELSPRFTGDDGAISTTVTGRTEVLRQLAEQAESDLQRAELLSAPVTFVALIVVFGSIVAALLPLAVGLVAVLGTFVVLSLLAAVTEVSVFSLNLTTGLGLGLAIDYSLFVVSRYREETNRGASPAVAVGRSMQTAGRTVAFSAGTVAISLSALAFFPVPYLRSFAYAGVAVVGLAAVASIVVLPAILAILGPRVERGRLLKVKATDDGEFWRRQADRVMRHPVPYAVVISAALVVLAVPFLDYEPGLSDDRVGPADMTSHVAAQDIREGFTSRESGALPVYLPGVDATRDAEAVDAFARVLASHDGVARVDAATGYYLVVEGDVLAAPPNDFSARFTPDPGRGGTYLSVVPDVEPFSSEGEELVAALRATDAPFEFLVAGPSAELVDTKETVADLLPLVLGAIALATFVLLFMMTGSLLVPVKALALNTLSLTATFGAMIWIFQEGHLSEALDFTATGTLDVFTPILTFCIAFGLSMDYEVFLLSRIKEEYDLEHDNERAVAVGLQKTGRIVTAAALLLTIVFAGIATSEVVLVKALGVGLGIAVLVDAFLIRATLVPAFMRLAGRLNWWSPRPLRRWHLRYGIWENEPVALLDRQFESLR